MTPVQGDEKIGPGFHCGGQDHHVGLMSDEPLGGLNLSGKRIPRNTDTTDP